MGHGPQLSFTVISPSLWHNNREWFSTVVVTRNVGSMQTPPPIFFWLREAIQWTQGPLWWYTNISHSSLHALWRMIFISFIALPQQSSCLLSTWQRELMRFTGLESGSSSDSSSAAISALCRHPVIQSDLLSSSTIRTRCFRASRGKDGSPGIWSCHRDERNMQRL